MSTISPFDVEMELLEPREIYWGVDFNEGILCCQLYHQHKAHDLMPALSGGISICFLPMFLTT